jgi:WD40 repeat protein
VTTQTADGYLAAGPGQQQAVIWTSRDGLDWQRLTAAQAGLAGPGETVQNIAFATSHGGATLIAGQVSRGGTTYDAAWLSTGGGSSWTRVSIPADHGANTQISGLAFDAKGLLAVRPGVTASGAPAGVAFFSPNGLGWQYAGTIDPPGGWTPNVVKGSDYGFVVTGRTGTGTIVAYTSTGTGGTWRPAGSLGNTAAESVTGVTVTPDGAVIAVGSTVRSAASQRPVFLATDAAGTARPVPVAGAAAPELAVNGLAVSSGQAVAVGSADGYPAVWHRAAGGRWSLVTPLSLVSSFPGLTALTSVTHGPSGWLAVGEPGPVVLTSPDGITWRQAGSTIAGALAKAPAVAAAAGPGGYLVAGTAPDNTGTPGIWWSPPALSSWTRASSMNYTSGSSQVLAVAADGGNFLAVGSHDHQPTVWATSDGRSWTAIVLGLPPGASAATLQQVAVNGDRVVVLGQEQRPAGPAPFAELSTNHGTSWQLLPFSSPGPDTTFTALTPAPGPGFAAAAKYGRPGRQQAALWSSANGTTWTISRPATEGTVTQIAALAPSAPEITAIATVATQTTQRAVVTLLPPP